MFAGNTASCPPLISATDSTPGKRQRGRKPVPKRLFAKPDQLLPNSGFFAKFSLTFSYPFGTIKSV
jgi:hypothetical protein